MELKYHKHSILATRQRWFHCNKAVIIKLQEIYFLTSTSTSSTHHQNKNGSKKNERLNSISNQTFIITTKPVSFDTDCRRSFLHICLKRPGWIQETAESQRRLFFAQETGFGSVQWGRDLPILPCLPAQWCWLSFHLAICHLSPGWAKLLSFNYYRT